MNNQRRRLLPVVILLLVVFGVWKFALSGRAGAGKNESGLDCEWKERLDVGSLEYSGHARCRMGCRHIDEALVEKVYLQGEVNCEKSSVVDGNARYALEMRDDQGDRIRIIVADDGDRHVIVTVIRLDRDDACHCS